MCKMQQICHRDLKLENTLLDGSPAPRLKICDFGYSKVQLLNYHINYLDILIDQTINLLIKIVMYIIISHQCYTRGPNLR